MKAILFCVCAMLAITAGAVDDSIKTVNVDPKVPLPDELVFSNPDTGWVQWVSGIGAIISDVTMNEQELKDALAKHNIKVDQMVRESFIAELKKSKLFEQVGASPADGTFHLVVEVYGVDRASFSMNLFAVIDLEAQLRDRNGKVLWEGDGSVDPMDSKMPDGGLDDFLQNKNDIMRKSFAEAARRVAIEVIEEYQEGKGQARKKATHSQDAPSKPGSSAPSSGKGTSPGNSVAKKGG